MKLFEFTVIKTNTTRFYFLKVVFHVIFNRHKLQMHSDRTHSTSDIFIFLLLVRDVKNDPDMFCLNIKSTLYGTRYSVREKGRDLTQSYYKSPYTHRKTQLVTWQNTNSTKKFDNTTIADRLRTVSLSNDRDQTGVVKPVNGIPTFTRTAKYVLSKNTHLKLCL